MRLDFFVFGLVSSETEINFPTMRVADGYAKARKAWKLSLKHEHIFTPDPINGQEGYFIVIIILFF